MKTINTKSLAEQLRSARLTPCVSTLKFKLPRFVRIGGLRVRTKRIRCYAAQGNKAIGLHLEIKGYKDAGRMYEREIVHLKSPKELKATLAYLDRVCFPELSFRAPRQQRPTGAR